MKKLCLWSVLFSFFISCSPDNITAAPEETNPGYALRSGGYPENSTNAFDIAGRLHNEISEAYFNGAYTDFTTSQIITDIEAIAAQNEDYVALKPAAYTPLSAARTDYLEANPSAGFTDIINNSALSATGRASFTYFINAIMALQLGQNEYGRYYDFIIGYEADVIADGSFTPADRKIILTATSITRYATFFASKHKRKPKDRDWEISVGNIIGSVEGNAESTSRAIMMAVACGIRHNF